MNQAERKIQSEERRRKSAEAQQFSEDRAQLLDTIREMIDAELDRRARQGESNPHPENPPPEHAGREPTRSGQTHSQPTQSNQPNSKQHRHTFWQRLVSLFSLCL